MLSRAARPLGTSLRLARSYATTPARKPASSAASFADIDDLPRSAKSASRPASTSKASPAAPSETAVAQPSHNEPSAPYNPPRAGSGPGTAVDAIQENWTTSFAGMSERPFDGRAAEVLGQDLDPEDVEMKPDGLIYLPEIKYRRILTKAFGPGGWAMAPRGETNVGPKVVSREWVLVCHGRFVATARGEQEYFDPNGIATASEGAKSNALMRCCKDLGIASELWDPRFIRDFKKKHCVEVFVEDAKTGRKRKLWRRKDSPPFEYPYKESK